MEYLSIHCDESNLNRVIDQVIEKDCRWEFPEDVPFGNTSESLKRYYFLSISKREWNEETSTLDLEYDISILNLEKCLESWSKYLSVSKGSILYYDELNRVYVIYHKSLPECDDVNYESGDIISDIDMNYYIMTPTREWYLLDVEYIEDRELIIVPYELCQTISYQRILKNNHMNLMLNLDSKDTYALIYKENDLKIICKKNIFDIEKMGDSWDLDTITKYDDVIPNHIGFAFGWDNLYEHKIDKNIQLSPNELLNPKTMEITIMEFKLMS